MSEHLPPARPHLKLTEDGRRMREVLSYSRRGSRLTARQQEAWDAYAARYVIDDGAVDAPGFSLAAQFSADQPLIVEIGCGIGEATAALAAARPTYNVLGIEVWRPGVADCVGRFGELGLDNVRMCSVDAVWTLQHLIAPDSISELCNLLSIPPERICQIISDLQNLFQPGVWQGRHRIHQAGVHLCSSCPPLCYRWNDQITTLQHSLDQSRGHLVGQQVP